MGRVSCIYTLFCIIDGTILKIVHKNKCDQTNCSGPPSERDEIASQLAQQNLTHAKSYVSCIRSLLN